MFGQELGGLQHALGLINVASDAHVVDGDLLQDTLRVDQVGAPEGHPIIL